MKTKTHISKKGNCTPVACITIGIGVALLTTILISIGLTSLVSSGSLELENLQFIIFVIRAVAVMIGAVVTTSLHKENVLLDIAILCAAYLVTLMAVSVVFYNGMFRNIGGGLLSIISGGAAACLIRLKPPRRRRINRRYTK